jgi:hypothetical protein
MLFWENKNKQFINDKKNKIMKINEQYENYKKKIVD